MLFSILLLSFGPSFLITHSSYVNAEHIQYTNLPQLFRCARASYFKISNKNLSKYA